MKNLLPVLFALLILSSCRKKEENIAVESVTIDKGKTAEVRLGETLWLKASVLPENATSKEVSWNSSTPSKARVSEGLVTPLEEGETVISATAGGVTDNCTVKVLPKFVAVAGIFLNPTTMSIFVEEKSTLKATIFPENASDPTVVWSSDKENIATVSEGVITAKKEIGTCTITAKSASDPTKVATCTVTVVNKEIPVTGISVDPVAAYILVNGTRQLTETITPQNATNKSVTWSTSDATIAEVSATGVVTAKSLGAATITVASVGNPDKTTTCAITVTDQAVAVTRISVAPADTSLIAGREFQLKHKIEPEKATNVEVTYTSSDEAKAIISKSGLVVSRKSATGNATITVKSVADPTKTATCRLTFKRGVETITVTPNAVSILVRQKKQLTATVLPSDAANTTVTWSSADPSKATVSKSGEVTALVSGQVLITATANDQSGTVGEATVTVIPIPVATSITITPEKPEVMEGKTLALKASVLPAEADQSIWWTSADNSKATVDPDTGVVTGVKAGETTIIATATDGTKVKGEVKITVQTQPTATLTTLTLGTENFPILFSGAGVATTTLTTTFTTSLANAPRTIAANLAQVPVNITATAGAIIKIGTTAFTSGQTVNFTNPVTFSVTEEGKVRSKKYTLTIMPYDATWNPYGIYTVDHLQNVRNAMNASFKLMNDLTLPATSVGIAGISDYASAGWSPIGSYDIHFEGRLDGEGHSINNLFIDRSTNTRYSATGLFAFVGSSGTIKNLGVNTVNEENRGVSGTNEFFDQFVGILTGWSDGTIENCYTTGKVFSHAHTQRAGAAAAGGLAGRAHGHVRRCYSTATVSGRTTNNGQQVYAGGLLGYSGAAVSDSYATGAVQGSNSVLMRAYVGGLVGFSEGGSLTRCYAAGDVNGASSTTNHQQGASAGGLIGRSASSITDCYALGNVTARVAVQSRRNIALAGGLIGWAISGTVSNCYAVGNTLATDAHDLWVGCLVACYESQGIFNNCYRNSNATRIYSNGGYLFTREDDLSGSRLAPKPLAEMKTEIFKGLLNGSSGTVWGRHSGTNNDLPYLIDVGVGR